jgi:phosphoribosylaminoimidazolecarboxamide formyltransferase/IMP cyclohydrolase
MPRALLSLTDKSGVVEFARALVERGFELVSTGGTAKALRDAGLTVTDVAEVTGFPEMLDGRVKTLHPLVHGGILADRRLPSHVAEAEAAGIAFFDVVAVNLYAFEQTVARGAAFDEVIENIDIGGPAMVRSAAKNHPSVMVVVDPADYPVVIDAIDTPTEGLRARLAAKAFRHTAFYDSMVSRWLTQQVGEEWPETMTVGLRRAEVLRYGENPHQPGALYRDPFGQPGIASANQLWGKALSYINIQDADAAWELANDLPLGSVAIIKHGNPCGVASGTDAAESYRLARAADPVSAFGGIVAVNGEVDLKTAEAMTEKGNFLEVIVATGFTAEARQVFEQRAGWGQNVRLLEAPRPSEDAYLQLRSVRGGVLVQHSDEGPANKWEVVSDRQPTEAEWAALKFGWSVVPHVKSNAIVVSGPDRLLGVGAGQMNRVQSVRLALEQAGEGSKGAALCSDAFFPFPDSIETAAAAGITAVAEPGGSVKDADVIQRANELGIALVFTRTRHFRH